MTIRKTALAAAAAAVLAAGCSSSDTGSDTANAQGFPDTITLAAIPAENSSDLKASYEPLIKLLEKETGSSVEFVQAWDYAGVVEGMIADNVDLAFFGPFAYVVAKINGAKITPLGAVIGEQGEQPGYQSYGLTRSDVADINGLKDFAGKKVCFVDPGSTSGFLYPTAGLIELPRDGTELLDIVRLAYGGSRSAPDVIFRQIQPREFRAEALPDSGRR